MSRPGPRPLAAVPEWNALFADSALLDELPLDALIDLQRQHRHLGADLSAAIARQTARTAGPPAPDGDVVGIDEAAHILGMKKSTLYRKWRSIGAGYKDIDGHPKFRRGALHRYLLRKGG